MLFPRSSSTSSEFRTVIRCLTIGIQDAEVLNIALELIMLGRPTHYIDEPNEPLSASSEVEAHL